MKGWFRKKIKDCLEKKMDGNINWVEAAKKTKIKKSTLYRMLEEETIYTKNLAKLFDYTGCYIGCDSKHKEDCILLLKKLQSKEKKAA